MSCLKAIRQESTAVKVLSQWLRRLQDRLVTAKETRRLVRGVVWFSAEEASCESQDRAEKLVRHSRVRTFISRRSQKSLSTYIEFYSTATSWMRKASQSLSAQFFVFYMYCIIGINTQEESEEMSKRDVSCFMAYIFFCHYQRRSQLWASILVRWLSSHRVFQHILYSMQHLSTSSRPLLTLLFFLSYFLFNIFNFY